MRRNAARWASLTLARTLHHARMWGQGRPRLTSARRLAGLVVIVVLAASVGLTPARAALVSSLESAGRAVLGVLGVGSSSPEPTPDPDQTLPPIRASEDVAGPPAPASGERATLEGRVVDAETGSPVAGAFVRIEPYGRRASTDSDGRFAFEDLPLPPDHCPLLHVIVRQDGHERSVAELYLVPGRNVAPDMRLRPLGEGTSADTARGTEPPACARGAR